MYCFLHHFASWRKRLKMINGAKIRQNIFVWFCTSSICFNVLWHLSYLLIGTLFSQKIFLLKSYWRQTKIKSKKIQNFSKLKIRALNGLKGWLLKLHLLNVVKSRTVQLTVLHTLAHTNSIIYSFLRLNIRLNWIYIEREEREKSY